MVRDTRCKAGDRLAVRSGDGAGVVLRAEVLTIDGGWHEPDEGNGVECDVRFSWAPAGCMTDPGLPFFLFLLTLTVPSSAVHARMRPTKKQQPRVPTCTCFSGARRDGASASTIMLLSVCHAATPWPRFAPQGGGPAPGSLGEVLEKLGEVPLPPYLRRESMPSDIADYQTVFSDGVRQRRHDLWTNLALLFLITDSSARCLCHPPRAPCSLLPRRVGC